MISTAVHVSLSLPESLCSGQVFARLAFLRHRINVPARNVVVLDQNETAVAIADKSSPWHEALIHQRLHLRYRVSRGRVVIDTRGPHHIALTPIHAIGFTAECGLGCPANIFLCQFPETVTVNGTSIAIPGYSRWLGLSRSYTEEALLHEDGGVEHFIAAHSKLFAVLDAAADLDVETRVIDETSYNKHRDPAKLAKLAERWLGSRGLAPTR